MEPGRRRKRNSTNAEAQDPETGAVSGEPANDPFAILEAPDSLQAGGQNREIHMYESRFNRRGEKMLLKSGSRSVLRGAKEVSVDAALVLTRYYSPQSNLTSTQLEIRSPYIKDAMKAVIRFYPSVNINSDGPIYINNSPWPLFHYRHEIHRYAMKLRDEKAKEHVLFALQYLKKVLGREIITYENSIFNRDIAPGLEFNDLWMCQGPRLTMKAEERFLCVKREIRFLVW